MDSNLIHVLNSPKVVKTLVINYYKESNKPIKILKLTP